MSLQLLAPPDRSLIPCAAQQQPGDSSLPWVFVSVEGRTITVLSLSGKKLGSATVGGQPGLCRFMLCYFFALIFFTFSSTMSTAVRLAEPRLGARPKHPDLAVLLPAATLGSRDAIAIMLGPLGGGIGCDCRRSCWQRTGAND